MKLRAETEDGRFYQWDTNQILIVEDAPNCQQVHFGYKDGSEARICRIYEANGKRIVDVPNELLRKDREIFAYLIIEEEDDTVTSTPQSFTVKSRAKPDDYVYTETEVQTYEALEERITALEENGGSGGGTVKTVNGIWPDENGNVEIAIPDSKVEIPAALPNPNALTFTGAVEATYDGSAAVSVEIPRDGGGEWQLLKEIAVESVNSIADIVDGVANSKEMIVYLSASRADATAISIVGGSLVVAENKTVRLAYYTKILQGNTAYTSGEIMWRIVPINGRFLRYAAASPAMNLSNVYNQGPNETIAFCAYEKATNTSGSIEFIFSDTVDSATVKVYGR